MKPTILAMAVLSVLIAGSVTAAQAQTWNVNVPFAFEARGVSFPAGHYEVSEVSNRGFLILRGKEDPAKQFIWVAHPNEANSKTDAVLTFVKTGSFAVLTSIEDPQVHTNAFRRAQAKDVAIVQIQGKSQGN
ncbi:MAG TPA: hypothetical protein VNX22_00760 [Acidobacteriaceae bacterium]|nr:hypothetical protein [Acidobacteriaceae bacterium]